MNIFYIAIPILISIGALVISALAYTINRNRLESSLYKNISDALTKFYDFASKEYEIKTDKKPYDKRIKHFYGVKRLYKIEVANQLEYACKNFLNGSINEQSFRDYYTPYLKSLVRNLKSLKSSPDTNEFESIEKTYMILKGDEQLFIPLWERVKRIIILATLVSIYIILMFNCYKYCFCG